MSESFFISFSLKLEIDKVVSNFKNSSTNFQKNINSLLTKRETVLLLKPKLISNSNNDSMLNILTLTDGSLVLMPYVIPSRNLKKNSIFLGQFISIRVSRNDCMVFF